MIAPDLAPLLAIALPLIAGTTLAAAVGRRSGRGARICSRVSRCRWLD
jgi:hypothetical protein